MLSYFYPIHEYLIQLLLPLLLTVPVECVDYVASSVHYIGEILTLTNLPVISLLCCQLWVPPKWDRYLNETSSSVCVKSYWANWRPYHIFQQGSSIINLQTTHTLAISFIWNYYVSAWFVLGQKCFLALACTFHLLLWPVLLLTRKINNEVDGDRLLGEKPKTL